MWMSSAVFYNFCFLFIDLSVFLNMIVFICKYFFQKNDKMKLFIKIRNKNLYLCLFLLLLFSVGWRYIIVSVGLSALLISVVTVSMWTRTKGESSHR